MKSITLFCIYIVTFFGFYMFLSLGGLILSESSYLSILHDGGWFYIYFIFIGWWISVFPAREYWIKHEDKFEEIF